MILQAPYFLFGLFAIAIPVIIHLVQLRKPQRVLFTNVAFIRNVEKITANQRKLKHWLILLSRILFLIFLVLVFCQPFIPARDNALAETAAVNIYLDNSGSMQNEADKGGVSLMEESIEEVNKITKSFPKSVPIQLLDNSFRTGDFRNLNPERIPDVLSQVQFSPLNRQASIIYSRLQSGKGQAQRTFWFSDFQRSTFDPGFFTKTDTLSQISLVHIKPASTANLFIDSVSLEDELVRLNENNRLLVRVYNNGDEPKKGVSLKLVIGNRQAAANSIDIEPKSAATAQLEFRLTDKQTQLARLEVEDQPVTFDNTYYFVLQPATAISILDINSSALSNTNRLFTNEPLFRYQSLGPGTANNQVIAQADLVLVNELTSVDAALADNLSKYVKNGGNLIIIPAEKTAENGYSNIFQSLGIPVRNAAEDQTKVSQLALPDVKNPFFRNIFTELDKRMQMPRAPKYLQWQRSDAGLLNFKDGSGFLAQFNSGKGKVYVFAAPFSAENNEFSRNALFVPVMYKLALSSHESEQQLAYNFSQRTFSLPVPKTDIRKSHFSLETDSLKFIPEQQLRNGKMFFTLPAEMAEAGFYKLKHNDSTLMTLAFNYPKSESLLDTYSAEELRSLIPNKNVKIYESAANADFREQFTRETKGTPLWQYCLLLALFFLLVEILLIRFL
ncbi:BatA domain-containing protein [Adhaeribacter soli]|uniref:BatA domain-containing protein n=1 Tax=Adhaeribacter soli TaxID=2607655 RepID=UPI001CDA383F|nr:BatA domain-containing protein [Adhaeribacter soli]